VLLEHHDRDLAELEQRMTANIHELVLPYVEKLKNSRIGHREQTLADIVESHLNDIITPFLNRLSSLHLLLTPQEVEVAALVRQGKSSQEIADVLGVSLSTIGFHRKNLRRKLGLHDRSKNLRTYLLSLK
jgi:DNA-binding CsgD family transcriptional regulator